MNAYRVAQGINDLILVTCQDCGTELVFPDGVELDQIGNAVVTHDNAHNNVGASDTEGE